MNDLKPDAECCTLGTSCPALLPEVEHALKPAAHTIELRGMLLCRCPGLMTRATTRSTGVTGCSATQHLVPTRYSPQLTSITDTCRDEIYCQGHSFEKSGVSTVRLTML